MARTRRDWAEGPNTCLRIGTTGINIMVLLLILVTLGASFL